MLVRHLHLLRSTYAYYLFMCVLKAKLCVMNKKMIAICSERVHPHQSIVFMLKTLLVFMARSRVYTIYDR